MDIPRYQSAADFLDRFNRSMVFSDELTRTVQSIIDEVRTVGDKALLEFTSRFDVAHRTSVKATQEDWAQIDHVPDHVKELSSQAAQNIRAFHEREFEELNSWDLPFGNGRVGQRVKPIQRAGVYVPGGKAAYPSSVLMNVIPAQVAGVPEIVLVSPPSRETGLVNDSVMAIAELLDVTEIFAIGGAQAIGALAYGTETIDPVDKITGPGNQYVNEAKRQVFGQVGIESLAGPSEILVFADESGNPDYIAADLLSQAEHDEQARAILVSTDEVLIEETAHALAEQLSRLPRKEIAEKSIAEQGGLIKVNNLSEGIELVNYIAPEHLELQLKDDESALEEIYSAGAVFMGHFTPEPVGDYWAGSNHILPTAGSARYASALSVRDFIRFTSVIEFDKTTLKEEGNSVAKFARLEGLEAHARAVDIRIKG